MIIPCPHCEAHLHVPEDAEGRTGRCPRCKARVPITKSAAISPAAVARAVLAAAERVGEAASLGGPLAHRGHMEMTDGAPVYVPAAGAGAYDLIDDDAAAPPPPLPVLLRATATVEKPKKSRREREEELAEIRSEGNRILWKLRAEYIGLGLFLLAVNIYYFTQVDEIVGGIKSQLIAAKLNPAKVEELVRTLSGFFRFECLLFGALGVCLGSMAVVVRWYARIASIAAFGTFVGVQVLDLLAIQAVFGGLIMGQSLFSLGTLIKIGIIAGLWHGIQVGAAYQEQVVDPERELKRQVADAYA